MNIYEPPYGHWFPSASESERVGTDKNESPQADYLEGTNEPGRFGNNEPGLVKPRKSRARRHA